MFPVPVGEGGLTCDGLHPMSSLLQPPSAPQCAGATVGPDKIPPGATPSHFLSPGVEVTSSTDNGGSLSLSLSTSGYQSEDQQQSAILRLPAYKFCTLSQVGVRSV